MATNKSLQLNNMKDIMAIDGHAIKTKTAGYGDIVFFQIIEETQEVVQGSVVASLRLSISQFEGLRDAIDSTLKQHYKKMESQNDEAKKNR